MAEASDQSPITIPIVVQDPRRTPNPVPVTVRGPLLAGPIGDRRGGREHDVPLDVVVEDRHAAGGGD